jgi:hypothetical protein
MKKTVSFFILLSLISALLSIAAYSVEAQSPYNDYNNCPPADFHIVPCGRSSNDGCTPEDETQMCTLCHLLLGIRRILHFGFWILVFLSLTMLTIAGIMYMVSAGNQGLMQSAKSLFFNTLIGFAIVLISWLAISYLMYLLVVYDDLGIGQSWFNFSCDTTSSAPAATTPAGG